MIEQKIYCDLCTQHIKEYDHNLTPIGNAIDSKDDRQFIEYAQQLGLFHLHKKCLKNFKKKVDELRDSFKQDDKK